MGDEFDALKREMMKSWRFRYYYYRSWPYYKALTLWMRLKRYIREVVRNGR